MFEQMFSMRYFEICSWKLLFHGKHSLTPNRFFSLNREGVEWFLGRGIKFRIQVQIEAVRVHFTQLPLGKASIYKFLGETPWLNDVMDYGLSNLELQLCSDIQFQINTFEKGIGPPYHPYYGLYCISIYSSTRMVLALNNPWRLICH